MGMGTPGPFVRRLLILSGRLLLICLLVKPFYASLPFILKIYPSERQILPQVCAFLSNSKSSLGERLSLKSSFPQTFRNLKVG